MKVSSAKIKILNTFPDLTSKFKYFKTQNTYFLFPLLFPDFTDIPDCTGTMTLDYLESKMGVGGVGGGVVRGEV